MAKPGRVTMKLYAFRLTFVLLVFALVFSGCSPTPTESLLAPSTNSSTTETSIQLRVEGSQELATGKLTTVLV
jgi:hypothetical protein